MIHLMKLAAVVLLVSCGANALVVEPKDQCICPRIYAPVCTASNEEFSNECLLDCEKSISRRLNDPRLEIKCNGECPCSQPEPEPADDCICTFNYEPVCGTDGNTYGNNCMLSCTQRAKSALAIECDGECPCA